MIKRVSATFGLTVKTATRTRLLPWVILCLAGVVFGLPEISVSGGTVREGVRMLLCWTLWSAAAVLGIGVLWAACSSFACDYDEKRLTGAKMTPSGAFEQWLGRWLGLGWLTGLLLLFVYAGVYVELTAKYKETPRPLANLSQTKDSAILAADALYDEMVRTGTLPEDLSKEKIAETQAEIKNRILKNYLPVAPGDSHSWRFARHPGGYLKGDRLSFKFSYVASYGGAKTSVGKCSVVLPTGEKIVSVDIDEARRGMFLFNVEASKLSRSEYFDVVFRNTQDAASGTAVLIDHKSSMTVQTHWGTTVGNMLRSYAVCFSVLLLLIGFGLALGMFFSFPVAVFSALALIFAVIVGRSELVDEGEAVIANRRDVRKSVVLRVSRLSVEASRAVSLGIKTVTDPFYNAGAFDKLGDGELIDANDVFCSIFYAGIILPLIAGALGAQVLSQRDFS